MLALFLLLFLALEIGFLGGRLAKQNDWVAKEASQSSGVIVGGMMTFLAFFLGMSLSIAFSGFQQRQAGVISEANAIETAWFLAGAQNESQGIELQNTIRDYAAVRIRASSSNGTAGQLSETVEESAQLQTKAWMLASQIENRENTYLSGALLQALTKAFNASIQQRQAFDMRVPVHIGKLLVITATSALLLIGFHIGMIGTRLWFPSGLLVATVVGAIGLISDLSRPFHGQLNVSPNALQWILDRMQ
ncbi:MAG: hypothetical protein ACR2O8_04190 [Rhizobiaceae bacterium]